MELPSTCLLLLFFYTSIDEWNHAYVNEPCAPGVKRDLVSVKRDL